MKWKSDYTTACYFQYSNIITYDKGSIPRKKNVKKKKISRPTDPLNFGPVSGNPSFIFFGLIVLVRNKHNLLFATLV